VERIPLPDKSGSILRSTSVKLVGETAMARVVQTQGTRGRVGPGGGNDVFLTTHRVIAFSGGPDDWMSVPLVNILLVERHGSRLVLKLPDRHELIIDCRNGGIAQQFVNEILDVRFTLVEDRR
jgi:hypothetical protein